MWALSTPKIRVKIIFLEKNVINNNSYLLLNINFPISSARGERVDQSLVSFTCLVYSSTLGVLDQHLPGIKIVRIFRQLGLSSNHPVRMDNGHFVILIFSCESETKYHNLRSDKAVYQQWNNSNIQAVAQYFVFLLQSHMIRKCKIWWKSK